MNAAAEGVEAAEDAAAIREQEDQMELMSQVFFYLDTDFDNRLSRGETVAFFEMLGATASHDTLQQVFDNIAQGESSVTLVDVLVAWERATSGFLFDFVPHVDMHTPAQLDVLQRAWAAASKQHTEGARADAPLREAPLRELFAHVGCNYSRAQVHALAQAIGDAEGAVSHAALVDAWKRRQGMLRVFVPRDVRGAAPDEEAEQMSALDKELAELRDQVSNIGVRGAQEVKDASAVHLVNLDRVAAMSRVLVKRNSELKRQSSVVQTLLAQEVEDKEKTAEQLRGDMRALRERISALEDEVAELRDVDGTTAELQARCKTLQRSAEDQQALREALQHEVANERASYANVDARIDVMKQRVELMEGQVRDATNARGRAETLLAESQQRVAQLGKERTALTAQLGGVRGDLAREHRELGELRTAHDELQRTAHRTREQLEKEVEDGKARVEELEKEVEERGVRVEALEKEVGEGKARVGTLVKEVEDGKARVEALEKDVEEGKARVEALEKEVERAAQNSKTRVDALVHEVHESRVNAEEMAGANEVPRGDADALRARVGALEARIAAMRAEDERRRAHAHYEYVSLTLLAVQTSFIEGTRDARVQAAISELQAAPLLEQANRQQIPFHMWHTFVTACVRDTARAAKKSWFSRLMS